MTIVMTVVVRDEADVLDAHLAYHLNAGVDLVLAADQADEATSEILESYARGGLLHRVPVNGTQDEGGLRAAMAQRAADELGAEWLIDAGVDEFWMPRGESLGDVLSVIPARYTRVQALARLFLPRPDDGRAFVERMTVRRPVYGAADDGVQTLDQALRSVVRADRRWVGRLGGRDEIHVPLRAWYPIEVLRFPFRSLEQAERRLSRVDGGAPVEWSGFEVEALAAQRQGDLAAWYAERVVDEQISARGTEDGSLVIDTRLLDALASVRATAPARESARSYALPSEGARMSLTVPDIVDDAAYAGECAAVHEVDHERLEAHITDLEQRIAQLERRIWPSVVRRLTRLARR